MKIKNIISYLIVAVIICFIIVAVVYSGTITKGKLTKSDIALWTGTSSTEWERETSTGYNLVLPYFDYVGVDVLEVYGGNVNANKATLQSALDAIETTNKRLIWMAPTTWDIDDDVTITSNIVTQVPTGCLLQIAAGKTLTINGVFEAGSYQVFSGTGTIVFGYKAVKDVYPEWWGAVADNSTDNTTAIQAAIDACHLGGALYFSGTSTATGGYITDSLTIKKPMTLHGGGRGSILKAKAAATGYLLNIDGEAAGASVGEHGAAFGQLYGVIVRDLHLDGNSRGASIGGVYQRTAEHCLYENLWIEDFQREAFNFYRSNRETYVNNNWIRWCGNKTAERTGYPAINLDDVGSGNDTNNGIYFYKVNLVYPLGDGVWMDTANGEAYNVRHCVFSNCYFHAIHSSLDGVGNNPFDATFTAAQKSCHMLDIGTVKQIQFANCMFPGTAGYEVAGIMIQEGLNGDPSDVLFEGCHIEGIYSAGADPTQDRMFWILNGSVTFNDSVIVASDVAGASFFTADSDASVYWGSTNRCEGQGPSFYTNSIKNSSIARTAVPLDLSGAAASQILFYGLPNDSYIHRIVFVYVEASSADAGVGIKVGKVSDDDYYYTGTTAINQSQWARSGATLLKHDIDAYDVVTVTSAGGKAGIGEIVAIIEYIMF